MASFISLHRQCHSPYRWNRAKRCKFGCESNIVVPETYIEERANCVIYRRRRQKDLKMVPYPLTLTKTYHSHINVKCTQGGETVAYLMKYAFKQSKAQEVVLNVRVADATGTQKSRNNTCTCRTTFECTCMLVWWVLSTRLGEFLSFAKCKPYLK